MALEKEDIMALISILQKGLETDEDTVTETSKKKKPAIKVKNKNQNQTKDKRVNKFLEMPERNMHREDSKIDKLLSANAPRAARNRSFQPVKVRCRLCGKEEEVGRSYVESLERYKCNKCSAMAG
jgi:hypothetical protein